jgi:hypothetical protein
MGRLTGVLYHDDSTASIHTSARTEKIVTTTD